LYAFGLGFAPAGMVIVVVVVIVEGGFQGRFEGVQEALG
jgi:hypothetical protein